MSSSFLSQRARWLNDKPAIAGLTATGQRTLATFPPMRRVPEADRSHCRDGEDGEDENADDSNRRRGRRDMPAVRAPPRNLRVLAVIPFQSDVRA
jgi:hypothetical protein